MISFFIYISGLIALFYFYRRWRFMKLSNIGLPGPEPNFLMGNLHEMRSKPYFELLPEWTKMFGKIFVMFEGITPNVVISDPDLLQEVMVNQFSNFHGRKLFPMQKNPDEEENVSMFTARGKRWKRLRTSVNQAFSEVKMRKMYPVITSCSENFMTVVGEELDKNSEGIVEIQEALQRLTLDIICKCAFGIDTNCQKNKNHPFVVSLKRFHSTHNFSNLKAAFVMTFPEIRTPFIKLMHYLNKSPALNSDLRFIRAKMVEVIEMRKSSTEVKHDLLQLMLDAEVTGTKVLNEENLCPANVKTTTNEEDNENLSEIKLAGDDSSKSKGNLKKPLTTDEVISQANLFLFAGYETSSTAMSFTMYYMATYPEVQQKLQAEIDACFESVTDTSYPSVELYDAILKLPYLNAVIYEVLRFQPFALPVVNRLCMNSEGTHLSNGCYIPPGANVIANGFSLHFDPDIWTGIDPKLFAPERYLDTTGSKDIFVGPPHPMSWIPFGSGPRNCIGRRFALMVVRSNLVRFFYNYTVKLSSKTQVPLQYKMGATVRPTVPIVLAVSQRNR